MTGTGGLRALIIGAGIGGMSAAIALRRIGVAVDLIDIDPGWRVAGAGITITGPTLRAFKDLGVYEEIAEQGYVGWGIRVHNVAGEILRDLDTPMPPEAGVEGSGGITRPVLHNILSKRVLEAGTNVRLGLSVDTIVQDESGVDITFGDGTTGRYDLAIGADGISSRTREQIFPNAPKAQYTGQSVWRIFCRRPADVFERHYFLGGRSKVGFTPVSDDEMYLFVVERTAQVWREGEELTTTLVELLEDYGGHIATIRDSITRETEVVFRPLEAFVLPAPWHVGRVLLIGDAAHPTTPQLASGAGIAVEDAIVLGQELEAARGNVTAAYNAFLARREERCRLVVGSSVEIGRLEQAQAAPEEQTAVVDRALAKLAEPI